MPTPAPSRTTQACRACRSLKVRCLPSGQGDVCQKCARSGADCVFEEQRPRRKRDKPDSRARVAALERKLEEVIAQVSQSTKAHSFERSDRKDHDFDLAGHRVSHTRCESPAGSTSSNVVHDTTHRPKQLPTPEGSTREGCTDLTSDQPTSRHRSQSTANSGFSVLPSEDATPEALISQGYLSVEDVICYIEHFREMCSYFPYVMIPCEISVCALLKDRPLLLHAVVAVASSSEVHLQKLLEKSLKEIILNRLVLEAEKSIDLLQSILVCIAWGHFFHVPKRDQSYQLLQMAIGLCVDLGLNLTPSSALQKYGLHLGHYTPTGEVEGDKFWSREARRAYLGCYHLSTMINWLWTKPNTLEYSDYIIECAKSISEAPEYPTDELVLPLVQLQQIGDEYHKILRVGRKRDHSEDLLDRIAAHTLSFRHRIQDLQKHWTSAASASTAVQLAMHFAVVYTNEQNLLSPFTSGSRMTAKSAQMDPLSDGVTCPSRIDILVECLQSAVEYLNLFLTIPPSFYSLLGMSQWSALIYSLVVMYRLSIGTPRVPLWDVQVARNVVKLEAYLEILCERTQQITRQRLRAVMEVKKRDLYSVMGLVLQNVRNTYERLRHLPQDKSSADEAPVHATSFPDQLVKEVSFPHPRPGPIFQHDQPRSGYQSRCPALQFWSTPQSSYTPMDGDMTLPPEDFYLAGDMIDDDGFWSQAFVDMARTEINHLEHGYEHG